MVRVLSAEVPGTGWIWFANLQPLVNLPVHCGLLTGSLYFSAPVDYNSATGNLSIENRQLTVLSFRKLSKLSFVVKCTSSAYSSPSGSLWPVAYIPAYQQSMVRVQTTRGWWGCSFEKTFFLFFADSYITLTYDWDVYCGVIDIG